MDTPHFPTRNASFSFDQLFSFQLLPPLQRHSHDLIQLHKWHPAIENKLNTVFSSVIKFYQHLLLTFCKFYINHNMRKFINISNVNIIIYNLFLTFFPLLVYCTNQHLARFCLHNFPEPIHHFFSSRQVFSKNNNNKTRLK